MTNLNLNFQTCKRKIASPEGTQSDLQHELPLLFEAFYKAVNDFERELVQTPIEARARGLEASLLNSKVLYRVQQQFPENWKFSKYKRFVLRINGYNILVKKLNSRNMPMNIKTKSSEAINFQLSLPLFDVLDVTEPIIYFGYKKDRFGNIVDPKLVYVDEGNVSWTITESQLIKTTKIDFYPLQNITGEPKLRVGVQEKKVSNL